MENRKDRAEQIQEAIAAVLLHDWDPIGVQDCPEAADEYDAYGGGVYRLLASGATAHDVAEHLKEVEEARMGGFGTTVDDLMPVAEKLLSIDVRL